MKNLASADNVSNDTLKYEGVADLDGINYNQSKTIDILIQRSSASAFTGFIFAKPAQLSAEVTSTTLTTKCLMVHLILITIHVSGIRMVCI